MKIDLLGEVVELLRQKHIAGWQDFTNAHGNFSQRHCDLGDNEVDVMNRFWRYILTNTDLDNNALDSAYSALCPSSSKREWIDNFKTYILCHISDIYDALGDYREQTRS